MRPRPQRAVGRAVHTAAFPVLLAVAAAVALASVAASAADPMAGRAKAQACADCHGAYGASPHPMIPDLAGQKEMYLLKQLMDFKYAAGGSPFARMGERTQTQMTHQMPGVSVHDMEDMAAWFANQPCPHVAAAADARKPAKAEHCGACHGKDGRSNAHFVPTIAGQKEHYLLAQLTMFLETARGLFPTDPGALREHPLMGPHAADLTDAERHALASWFAGRACR